MSAVNLARFIDAQEGGGSGTSYAQALKEIQAGSKDSCWIWYIFPQFLDPARASSSNNQKYQLRSCAEIVAFLRDDTLGPRFAQISKAVAEALKSRNTLQLMGGEVDAKKLHQSVTCFHFAAREAEFVDLTSVLTEILERIQQQPYAEGIQLEDPIMTERWRIESAPAAATGGVVKLASTGKLRPTVGDTVTISYTAHTLVVFLDGIGKSFVLCEDLKDGHPGPAAPYQVEGHDVWLRESDLQLSETFAKGDHVLAHSRSGKITGAFGDGMFEVFFDDGSKSYLRASSLRLAGSTVRVMSFNMRLDTEEDADVHGQDCRWLARRDSFLQVILRERPDLVGIQEVLHGQAKDLTEALSRVGYDCRKQERGRDGSEAVFIAILAPWRVTRTGKFWLAVDTPEVPGSKAFGAKFPRVAIWAALEKVGSEEKLLFLNTHFDHPTTEAAEGNRTRSAEQIGEFLQQDWPGWPAVVTLDANGEPGAPAHRKFGEMGLVDSWAECHPDDALCRPNTFHQFLGPRFSVPSAWSESCWPGSLGPSGRKTCHIDWVLHTSSLTAACCEIDYTEGPLGTSPPSDHFAVIAKLTFA